MWSRRAIPREATFRLPSETSVAEMGNTESVGMTIGGGTECTPVPHPPSDSAEATSRGATARAIVHKDITHRDDAPDTVLCGRRAGRYRTSSGDNSTGMTTPTWSSVRDSHGFLRSTARRFFSPRRQTASARETRSGPGDLFGTSDAFTSISSDSRREEPWTTCWTGQNRRRTPDQSCGLVRTGQGSRVQSEGISREPSFLSPARHRGQPSRIVVDDPVHPPPIILAVIAGSKACPVAPASSKPTT